jgi:hypothetical protein
LDEDSFGLITQLAAQYTTQQKHMLDMAAMFLVATDKIALVTRFVVSTVASRPRLQP